MKTLISEKRLRAMIEQKLLKESTSRAAIRFTANAKEVSDVLASVFSGGTDFGQAFETIGIRALFEQGLAASDLNVDKSIVVEDEDEVLDGEDEATTPVADQSSDASANAELADLIISEHYNANNSLTIQHLEEATLISAKANRGPNSFVGAVKGFRSKTKKLIKNRVLKSDQMNLNTRLIKTKVGTLNVALNPKKSLDNRTIIYDMLVAYPDVPNVGIFNITDQKFEEIKAAKIDIGQDFDRFAKIFLPMYIKSQSAIKSFGSFGKLVNASSPSDLNKLPQFSTLSFFTTAKRVNDRSYTTSQTSVNKIIEGFNSFLSGEISQSAATITGTEKDELVSNLQNKSFNQVIGEYSDLYSNNIIEAINALINTIPTVQSCLNDNGPDGGTAVLYNAMNLTSIGLEEGDTVSNHAGLITKIDDYLESNDNDIIAIKNEIDTTNQSRSAKVNFYNSLSIRNIKGTIDQSYYYDSNRSPAKRSNLLDEYNIIIQKLKNDDPDKYAGHPAAVALADFVMLPVGKTVKVRDDNGKTRRITNTDREANRAENAEKLKKLDIVLSTLDQYKTTLTALKNEIISLGTDVNQKTSELKNLKKQKIKGVLESILTSNDISEEAYDKKYNVIFSEGSNQEDQADGNNNSLEGIKESIITKLNSMFSNQGYAGSDENLLSDLDQPLDDATITKIKDRVREIFIAKYGRESIIQQLASTTETQTNDAGEEETVVTQQEHEFVQLFLQANEIKKYYEAVQSGSVSLDSEIIRLPENLIDLSSDASESTVSDLLDFEDVSNVWLLDANGSPMSRPTDSVSSYYTFCNNYINHLPNTTYYFEVELDLGQNILRSTDNTTLEKIKQRYQTTHGEPLDLTDTIRVKEFAALEYIRILNQTILDKKADLTPRKEPTFISGDASTNSYEYPEKFTTSDLRTYQVSTTTAIDALAAAIRENPDMIDPTSPEAQTAVTLMRNSANTEDILSAITNGTLTIQEAELIGYALLEAAAASRRSNTNNENILRENTYITNVIKGLLDAIKKVANTLTGYLKSKNSIGFNFLLTKTISILETKGDSADVMNPPVDLTGMGKGTDKDLNRVATLQSSLPTDQPLKSAAESRLYSNILKDIMETAIKKSRLINNLDSLLQSEDESSFNQALMLASSLVQDNVNLEQAREVRSLVSKHYNRLVDEYNMLKLDIEDLIDQRKEYYEMTKVSTYGHQRSIAQGFSQATEGYVGMQRIDEELPPLREKLNALETLIQSVINDVFYE